MANMSISTEFILLGFPDLHELKPIFYTSIFLMYLLSLLGHSLIITVVCVEPMLHTPMYFFLVNFSMAEICSTTAETPKMLFNAFLGKNTICYVCCMMQFITVFTMGAVMFITLTIMSLDRYIAICKPLRYKTIMTNELCLSLALIAWISGFVIILAQTVVIWSFPYCRHNVIDHFFCDVGPLLKLACGDITLIELIGYVYGAIFMWGSFGLSLISYTCIIATVVQIPSATGRSKAFLTCTSHLTVIVIFYSADLFMYMRPATQSDTQINKVVSLVRTSFIPMLNPFIYTIRNKDFKTAAWKTVRRKFAV